MVVMLAEGDEAVVRVQPRSRLMPAVPVTLRVDGQPDFPHDPIVRLRWSMPSAGPLAFIARNVAGYITLPEGVRIDRDLVLIDLRALLRARGAGDVLALVRRVAIHTRPGALVIELEAGIS